MLILLSHGESTAQEDNIVSGQVNDPLSECGKAEAIEAGKSLADYDIDVVYCSDLERCQDTANIVMAGNHFSDNVELILVQELRERSFGSLEGTPYPVVRKELPPKKYKLWNRDYFEAPPQGESLQDVEQRVIPFLKANAFPLADDNKNILVVTHNDVVKTIIGHLKKSDETDIIKWKIENAIPYFFYGKTCT